MRGRTVIKLSLGFNHLLNWITTQTRGSGSRWEAAARRRTSRLQTSCDADGSLSFVHFGDFSTPSVLLHWSNHCPCCRRAVTTHYRVDSVQVTGAINLFITIMFATNAFISISVYISLLPLSIVFHFWQRKVEIGAAEISRLLFPYSVVILPFVLRGCVTEEII